MPGVINKDTLRSRIREIRKFHRESGRMPSYSEISGLTGLRSKNAVFKFVGKLENLKVLERDGKGKLIPLAIANPVKVLGTVEAGFPSPVGEPSGSDFRINILTASTSFAIFPSCPESPASNIPVRSIMSLPAVTSGSGSSKMLRTIRNIS